jgi:hypothetical protein
LVQSQNHVLVAAGSLLPTTTIIIIITSSACSIHHHPKSSYRLFLSLCFSLLTVRAVRYYFLPSPPSSETRHHKATNICNTIKDAFSTPLSHLDRNMIRITLVVGAGKLSRSKYDDRAMISVTSTLKQLGYVEDRGASCVIECGGCYKTQHDTGKNLFTVVVFPRLAGRHSNSGGGGGGGGGAQASSPSSEYPIPIPLAEGTPVHTILLASEETFGKMVPSICPSWSEKKMCSEVLNLAIETVQAMDAKLISGAPLTDDENSYYDAVGGAASIGTKVECLRKIMQEQVEGGLLTRHELERLLMQVEEKIDILDSDIDRATQDAEEKKAVRLTAQKERAEDRRRMLGGHKPRPPHPLKHEARIAKLRNALAPLLKLEQITKGRLLTIQETRELAAKDDMLGEISELEESSRGMFEEDDAFEVRLMANRSKKQLSAAGGSSAKAAPGGGGKKPAGTTGGSRSANAAWLAPGGLAAKQTALGKKAASANKSKPKTPGGVFAAMMIDSDSDGD